MPRRGTRGSPTARWSNRRLIDAKLRHVRTEKRQFQFQYTQEDYLTGLEIWATGRFVKEMLGDAGWPAFQERVRTTFAERFSDPLNDFRDVILADRHEDIGRRTRKRAEPARRITRSSDGIETAVAPSPRPEFLGEATRVLDLSDS